MSKNIVLVIGAGASHDFNNNMGIGNSLIQDIKNRVYELKDPYLSNVMQGMGYLAHELKSFHLALNNYLEKTDTNSQPKSIDTFLNNYKTNQNKFLEIGRMMILLHILGYEQKCTQNASFQEQSWLSILSSILNKNDCLNPIHNNEIKFNIITFNYDRLVEEFLYRKYGQKVECFANNKIIHIYNKIAYLPWQHLKLGKIASDNKEFIKNGNFNEVKSLPFLDFGHPNYDSFIINQRKDDIKLIYELERDTNKFIDESIEIIKNAKKVLFMGFAYDIDNLKALGLNCLVLK